MIELPYIHHSRRRILWLSNRQPVFSPSATLFHPSLGSNFHKAQALSERHIDALATQFWVWLRESRIDDPHVTALVQHKRTVLMVAFGVPPSHLRQGPNVIVEQNDINAVTKFFYSSHGANSLANLNTPRRR
jgi:hypothetical protein